MKKDTKMFLGLKLHFLKKETFNIFYVLKFGVIPELSFMKILFALCESS